MCVVYSSCVNVMVFLPWIFKGECRLQMEAQRISLSQIHAAQLELLQEETDARTHSVELKLQNLKDQGDQGEQLRRQLAQGACVSVAKQRFPQRGV